MKKQPSSTDEFFCPQYTPEQWLDDVLGGDDEMAAARMFEFVDYLIKHGTKGMGNDLERLRRKLFSDTSTFNSAYELYIQRHELRGNTDDLINSLLPDKGGKP